MKRVSNRGMSVIICCYNSAERIEQTIDYLAKQTFKSQITWEVIIVDNLSQDNTSDVARKALEKITQRNFSYQILNEGKQGLNFARKTGVEEAKYEYFIFCDDDNWLHSAYIETAYSIIDTNPKIGALGGQSYPISYIEFPSWFDDYKIGYAIGKQAHDSGDISSRGYVWGAGMVSRRSLFLKSINDKLPSILTDRKGNELSSGGDYEYCQRLLLQGYSLHYHESLIFGHFIPANRLTLDYRDKLFKSFDESLVVLSKYSEAISFKQHNGSKKLKLLLTACIDLIKSVIRSRKPKDDSLKIIFYLLNIGYKTDHTAQIIRHFYTT